MREREGGYGQGKVFRFGTEGERLREGRDTTREGYGDRGGYGKELGKGREIGEGTGVEKELWEFFIYLFLFFITLDGNLVGMKLREMEKRDGV